MKADVERALAAGTPAAIDTDAFADLLDAVGPDEMEAVLAAFLEKVDADKAAISRAVVEGDLEAARRTAHTLKGGRDAGRGATR